jgi:hypothetical protein|nr:MAG TPA: holin [Caudoviricetes sp.]
MNEYVKELFSLWCRYILTLLGALFAMLEPTIPFCVICTLAVLCDCYTAWALSRRIKKKYGRCRCDGKFKSNHAGRVIVTLIKVYVLIVLSFLIDLYIFPDWTFRLPNIVAGAVCFWQVWSILENESSCNDARWAKIAQRIMVDKTERHFNIDLHELKDAPSQPDNDAPITDGVPCDNIHCDFRGGGACDPPKCEMYVKPKNRSNGES